MLKIIPSILTANFANLEKELNEVKSADMIHLDIMDGHFVPNISFGQFIVKIVNTVTDLPLDVHLMIGNSEDHIEDFVKAGADIITVHREACSHLHRVIRKIKSFNIKAGIAISPATSIETIKRVLPYVDIVLIMTVNPGLSGQPFIPEMVDKIKKLKQYINENNLDIEIEVDGGINAETVKLVVEAGATMIVATSAIFGKSDRAEAIRQLRIE